MAGIGYQPDFFSKFHTILEKAESTGDPGITKFSSHPEDLTNPMYKPCIDNLVAHNLLQEIRTPHQIFECLSTCTLLSKHKYFNHGNQTVGLDSINHYDMISKAMRTIRRRGNTPADNFHLQILA